MRVLLVIVMLFGILNAQNREALLIGNSNYQYISNLNDTSHNLSRLKRTLEQLGFTVKIKNDLSSKKLKQAIDNFRDRLARNRDTIGFFYYSGHGCQMDNVGYLIPTNVNSSKKLDVQYDALNIDKMLETLKEAGNRVNMLFLDACRDNTPTGTKGGKKGLAQAPLTPKGTLVVYATEATKTADDNNNFINSLIVQIEKPNKSIRDIGYNISDDVASQTREHQVPQVFAQRVPKIFLNQIQANCQETVKEPARYKMVLSKEKSKRLIIIPTVFKTVREKVLMRPAFTYYKWDGGVLKPKLVKIVNKIISRVSYTKLTLNDDRISVKKIKVPPLYKTVTRERIVKEIDLNQLPSDKNVKEVSSPAYYKTVKKKIVFKPSVVKTIPVPAQYKKVLIRPETEKIVSIPCSEIN